MQPRLRSKNKHKKISRMPPKRNDHVLVAQWFWFNDTEWIPYSREQNELLEHARAVKPPTLHTQCIVFTYRHIHSMKSALFMYYSAVRTKLMLIRRALST